MDSGLNIVECLQNTSKGRLSYDRNWCNERLVCNCIILLFLVLSPANYTILIYNFVLPLGSLKTT